MMPVRTWCAAAALSCGLVACGDASTRTEAARDPGAAVTRIVATTPATRVDPELARAVGALRAPPSARLPRAFARRVREIAGRTGANPALTRLVRVAGETRAIVPTATGFCLLTDGASGGCTETSDVTDDGAAATGSALCGRRAGRYALSGLLADDVRAAELDGAPDGPIAVVPRRNVWLVHLRPSDAPPRTLWVTRADGSRHAVDLRLPRSAAALTC